MQLTGSATYYRNSDFVEVRIYKTDSDVVVPITSGLVQLKQNNELIEEIEVNSFSNFVSFFHPRALNNLTVNLIIDSLTFEMPVVDEAKYDSAIAHVQPAIDENFLVFQKLNEVEIDTSKEMEGPIVLSLDFAKQMDFEYSGGNRMLFDSTGKIVTQDINQILSGDKYSEVATTNLIGQQSLLTLFSFTCPNRGCNFKISKDYGIDSLRFYCGGAIDNGIKTPSKLTLTSLKVENAKTVQFYFGIDKQITATTFSLICNGYDAANVLLDSNTQTFNISDFVNNTQLLYATVSNTNVTKISCNIEIEGIFPLDVFNLDIVMPQMTSLLVPTSYTTGQRQADIYAHDVVLPLDQGSIELDMTASNLPCTLFDCNSVKAYYDGTALFFNINGAIISWPCILSDGQIYQFSWDKNENIMDIIIDDQHKISGGLGFDFTSNSKMFIGCSSLGTNQINGILYKLKVLR